ncbi:hypothetical protein SARC_13278 [Sphaeroforma arctica JP610]|uniref:Uncharacterized protein n=1 Tax=Sphaeroforma arctica JP610 TaxID=667725 RepID=A0A0L0FCI9_9EUKA|nr:hypothetical protein SARC_13278 [Sphaeroforma arctica JP610]KNC74166.1 hypothetical protein SARC_13278 [Sphaeroforma arctica JP610]|eukprot:XP_014148068.1 hypothetical protein SARC_13278 [Sphaeroforma arctica JP610]
MLPGGLQHEDDPGSLSSADRVILNMGVRVAVANTTVARPPATVTLVRFVVAHMIGTALRPTIQIASIISIAITVTEQVDIHSQDSIHMDNPTYCAPSAISDILISYAPSATSVSSRATTPDGAPTRLPPRLQQLPTPRTTPHHSSLELIPHVSTDRWQGQRAHTLNHNIWPYTTKQ